VRDCAFPDLIPSRPGDREAGGVQGCRLCWRRPRSGFPCGPTGASGSGFSLICAGHASQPEAHACEGGSDGWSDRVCVDPARATGDAQMRLVRREIDPVHDAGLPASSGPRDRSPFRLWYRCPFGLPAPCCSGRTLAHVHLVNLMRRSLRIDEIDVVGLSTDESIGAQWLAGAGCLLCCNRNRRSLDR
jgi:hypothetical protein